MTYVGPLAALAFTLGLLLLVLFLLRRLRPGTGASPGSIPIRVLSRMAINQRQGVATVRVGRQVLIVSMGEGGVRTLGQLSEQEADLAIEADEAHPVISFADTLARAKQRAGLNTKTPSMRMRPLRWLRRLAPVLLLAVAFTFAASGSVGAQAVVGGEQIAPQFELQIGGAGEGEGVHISGAVGIVLMMGLLTVLPTLLLLTTSFTRILVVLNLLRQALGTQNAPPAHLLAAIALLLTGVVMAPTLSQANEFALQPYLRGEISQTQAFAEGVVPFREFMLRNTGENELALFIEMAGFEEPPASVGEIPTPAVMGAFVITELKAAFKIAFAIFLPFIVVDLVAGSVLMSLGMIMLPPALISLPFKLLLFVLADGWYLVVRSLVLGYQ